MGIKQNPRRVAKSIVQNFDIASPPRKLISIIEHLLIEEGYGEVTAFEIASDLLYPVRDELSQIILKYKNDSVIPSCELVGTDFLNIIGSAFKRPNDSSKKSLLREVIPYLNEIWETLCLLEPYLFEVFCSKILLLMGATEAITTKRTGDEGIDFLGKLRFPNSFDEIGLNSMERSFFINIFGQAKRYSKDKTVGTGEIRELIGSLSILRYQEIVSIGNSTSIKKQFGEIRLCDPLVCMFVTTGYFSSQAIQLAERTGVITKDGKQLATYLALKQIGFDKNGDSCKFNRLKFHSWVES